MNYTETYFMLKVWGMYAGWLALGLLLVVFMILGVIVLWLDYVWAPMVRTWARMFPARTVNAVTKSGPGLAKLGEREGGE